MRKRLPEARTRRPKPVTDSGTSNSNFSNHRPVVLDVDLGHHLELENCTRMDRTGLDTIKAYV